MATRNFVPRATDEGQIGTNLKRWLKGVFYNLTVTNSLTDGTNTTSIESIVDTKANIDTLELIAESQLVSSTDIIEDHWSTDSLRYMLDPINGNDDNNGKTWATAKKTLQSVVDVIPKILGVLNVHIFTQSGNCGGATFAFEGGKILIRKVHGAVTDTFITNDENVTFNTNPLVINGDLVIKLNSFLQIAGQSENGLPYGSVEFAPTGYFGILTQNNGSLEIMGVNTTSCSNYWLFANGGSVYVGKCSIKGDIIVGDQSKIFAFNGDVSCDVNFPSPFTTRNAVNDDVKVTSFSTGINGTVNIDVSQIEITSGSFTIDGDKIPQSAIAGDIGNTIVGSKPSLHIGNQAMLRNLPTTDPLISGALWSNSGIVTVSAG